MKQLIFYRKLKREEMECDTQKYWDNYRNSGKEDTFERMSAWLNYSGMKSQHRKKGINKSSKIIQILSMNKVKVAAVLGLILLVSLGNYPVTKNKTIGYIVKFTAPVEKVVEVNEQLEKLNWMDKSSITVQEKDSLGHKMFEYKILLNESAEKDIAVKKTELEKIQSANFVQVMPIAGAIEVPMYSVALGNIFKIDETERIVNEKEFQTQIQTQFNNAGMESFVFTVNPVREGKKYSISVPQNIVIDKDSLKKLNRIILLEIENVKREVRKDIHNNEVKLKIQMEKLAEQQENLIEKLNSISIFNGNNNTFYTVPDSLSVVFKEDGQRIIINPEEIKVFEGESEIEIPGVFNFTIEGLNKKEKQELKKKLQEDIRRKVKEAIEKNKNKHRDSERNQDVEIPEIEIPEIEIPEIEIPETEN